jgi:hypothetical protein
MPDRDRYQALRAIVWVARATCCFLIVVAIFNVPQIGALTQLAGSFTLLASVTLGVIGIACLVGLELFLRSFYQYFSRN